TCVTLLSGTAFAARVKALTYSCGRPTAQIPNEPPKNEMHSVCNQSVNSSIQIRLQKLRRARKAATRYTAGWSTPALHQTSTPCFLRSAKSAQLRRHGSAFKERNTRNIKDRAASDPQRSSALPIDIHLDNRREDFGQRGHLVVIGRRRSSQKPVMNHQSALE